MFCCFDSSFWIGHVVLVAHSLCILIAYSGLLCFVVLIAHFGYVFCFDNSFWICIVVLIAHLCHYFTTRGAFSRPAFLNCSSWVGHKILKTRTLLMMNIIWNVCNYKITPLGWREDVFLPWQVLDKVSCGTRLAVVLIHHSRQSAVFYEKCLIMRGQFCTP
jgi:hypothetical protein